MSTNLSLLLNLGVGLVSLSGIDPAYEDLILHYTVYEDKNIILLTNITPEGILDEGHRAELNTYKGVMISKTNPEKDMFKVNLLNMLQK